MNALLGTVLFLLLTGLCGGRCVRLLAPWAVDQWQRLAQGVLFAFAWFSLFAFFGYAFELSFAVFFFLYGVGSIIFLTHTQGFSQTPRSDASKPSRTTWFMAILVVLGGLLLLLLVGFFGGDGIFHQAKIQHLLQTQRFSNNDPYVPHLFDDRYAFATWHALIAAAMAGLQAPQPWVVWTWYALAALLLPAALAAQYFWGSVVFRSRLAGSVMALLWLLHLLILAYNDDRFWSDAQTLNYPSGLCVHVLIPTGLALYLQWGEHSRLSPWRWGSVLGILTLCVAFAHLFYGLLFLASLAFLCLAVRLVNTGHSQWRRRWFFPYLTALAIAAVYYALRLVTLSPIQNQFFDERFGWKSKFLLFSDTAYILDPSLTVFSLGHYQSDRIALFAILTAILALPFLRRSLWVAYGCLSTIVVTGALSLPPVVALLSEVITAYKVPRLTLLIPHLVLVTGAVVWLSQTWKNTAGQWKRIALLAGTFAVGLWVYHDAGPRLEALWQQLRGGKMRHAIADSNYTQMQRLWREHAERPMIMGHEDISYTLGAYTPIWAVNLPAAHAALGYPYAERRDLYRFLTSEAATLFDVQRLAFDYSSDYLILRRDEPIAEQLHEHEIAAIGQFFVFPLPLSEKVFTGQIPSPWLHPQRWRTRRSRNHDTPSAWGPGETVRFIQLPGSSRTLPGRILKTDGLERSMIYLHHLPSAGETPPDYVSFWIYVERAEPIVFKQIAVTWEGGHAVWSQAALERVKISQRLHNGWNAMLLAMQDAERIAQRQSDACPGFKVSMYGHTSTASPQYIKCAIRDIQLYFRRPVKK